MIKTRHTSELSQGEKQEVLRLLQHVYGDDYTQADFACALGGLHFLLYEEHRLVGHVALIQRSIAVDGIPYKVGYVESMGILPNHQRKGLGMKLMAAVNDVIETVYEFGALSPSEEGVGLYLKSGWEKISGPFYEYNESGIAMSDEADVMVYPAEVVAGGSQLVCDYRKGDAW